VNDTPDITTDTPTAASPVASPAPAAPELSRAADRLKAVAAEVAKIIIGQDAMIEQIMVALLARGHVLLEGVPGTAKTLTVRALSAALHARMKRIQFTPDLMPSDITGTNVFDLREQNFKLRPGPIFTDLLLADEINRAPAKTQAALLEAMSERHATIDGDRRELSPIFTVFATQNPIEFEGTYPLPEAQQDRFMLKIRVDYPDAEAEMRILDRIHRGQAPDEQITDAIKPVLTVAELQTIAQALPGVRVEPGVMRYVLQVVLATRKHEALVMGAGPRGSIYLLQAAKARALIHSRDFVTPDDVVAMAEPVLGHRIVMTAEAEISGETPAGVLRSILDKIEVPR